MNMIRLSLCMIILALPAQSMNWEGHDGFFHEVEPLPAFTDNVAPPLVQKRPSCAERRKRHFANPYEQTPVAGVNCVGAKSD